MSSKICVEAHDRIKKLEDLLDRIYRHWQDGVSEETEDEKPWHGKMRDILNER